MLSDQVLVLRAPDQTFRVIATNKYNDVPSARPASSFDMPYCAAEAGR